MCVCVYVCVCVCVCVCVLYPLSCLIMWKILWILCVIPYFKHLQNIFLDFVFSLFLSAYLLSSFFLSFSVLLPFFVSFSIFLLVFLFTFSFLFSLYLELYSFPQNLLTLVSGLYLSNCLWPKAVRCHHSFDAALFVLYRFVAFSFPSFLVLSSKTPIWLP